MKYIKYFNETKNIIIGYRAQFGKQLTKTIGVNATEGEGYYIAKDIKFAEMFMDDNKNLLEITFNKPKKILHSPDIFDDSNSFLGWSGYGEIWENPIKDTDSEWIKFHKLALEHSEDSDETIQYFTKLVKDAGYDAIEVRDDEEGWYVIFDEKLIINTKIL